MCVSFRIVRFFILSLKFLPFSFDFYIHPDESENSRSPLKLLFLHNYSNSNWTRLPRAMIIILQVNLNGFRMPSDEAIDFRDSETALLTNDILGPHCQTDRLALVNL